VHPTGSLPDCPCILERKATFQEEFLLTGSQGTLTLKDETLLTPMEEPSIFGETRAAWQIESGTGDYDRASGHGTGYFGPPVRRWFPQRWRLAPLHRSPVASDKQLFIWVLFRSARRIEVEEMRRL
jgi:hypothetical protein